MPKEPKDYKPSPWINEKLDLSQVRIPPAMVGALYQLQKDKQEVEYGGAIDFELVHGQPVVERVLAYTGAVGEVSREVWEKVFMSPDIELTFHTHPAQLIAIPSEGDILFFLTTAPKTMLIVAGTEAILLAKGESTPPPEFAQEHFGDMQKTIKAIPPSGYSDTGAKKDQRESRRELETLLDIDTFVFPKTELC